MTLRDARCWSMLALLLFSGSSIAQDPRASEPDAAPVSENSAVPERDFTAALAKRLDWNFDEVSIKDFTATLQKQTGVDFLIDVKSLEDAAIGTDALITFHARSLPVEAGLNLALETVDLTWIIRDAAITILSHDSAASQLTTRVYDVRELVDESTLDDSLSLVALIKTAIAFETWSESGGPGSLDLLNGSLVAFQTRDVHRMLQDLIHTVRDMRHADSNRAFTYIDRDAEAIHQALSKRITFACEEIALLEAAKKISDAADINIVVDRKALEDAAIGSDSLVSVSAQQLPVRVVLKRLLGPLDLTWTIQDGAVIITTRDIAEQRMAIRLYSIAAFGTSPSDVQNRFNADGLPRSTHLVGIIQKSIAPDSWDVVGGNGSVQAAPQLGLLVVTQVEDAHEQIADLVNQFQNLHRGNETSAPPTDTSGSESKANVAAAETRQESRTTDPLQFDVYHLPLDTAGKSFYSARELVEVVRTAVEPDSWSKEPNVFILPVSNGIAIRHRESVQRRIHALLLHMNAVQFPKSMLRGGFF